MVSSGERTTAIIKNEIAEKKKAQKELCDVCKISAKKLVVAAKELSKAEAAYAKKTNRKTEDRLIHAKDEYSVAGHGYQKLLSDFDALCAATDALYTELMEVNPVKINKIRREAEKFDEESAALRAQIIKITEQSEFVSLGDEEPVDEELADELQDDADAGEAGAGEADEADAANEYNAEQANRVMNPPPQQNMPPYGQPQYPPQGMYAPAPGYYGYAQPMYQPPAPAPAPSVNVSPVTVDVNPIVEKAVAEAMERFKSAFSMRAEEYVKLMAKSNASIAEMQEKILEDEKYIIDKLAAIMGTVKESIDRLTDLGASSMQLSNSQKDAVELQRKVNDMQRALTRELQGVQVNQRLINQDQARIAEEQVVILEQEKATFEAQTAVLRAREVAEMDRVAEAAKAKGKKNAPKAPEEDVRKENKAEDAPQNEEKQNGDEAPEAVVINNEHKADAADGSNGSDAVDISVKLPKNVDLDSLSAEEALKTDTKDETEDN